MDVHKGSGEAITPHIWSDFNGRDENGRCDLNYTLSLQQLAEIPDLKEGMTVVAYSEGIEIDVFLIRDAYGWWGIPASEYRDSDIPDPWDVDSPKSG